MFRRAGTGATGREPPGVSDDLRELLALSPSFRLLVAHGRTDLVTPYGVSRYVLDHLPDMGAPDRAQLKLYRGGHMFYFDAGFTPRFHRRREEFLPTGPLNSASGRLSGVAAGTGSHPFC